MLTQHQIDELGANLKDARTPEEAAQLFHATVSDHLIQFVADVLAKTKEQAVRNNMGNAANAGWLDYVKGCSITLDWPTPRMTAIQIGQPIFKSSTISAAAKGGEITVSIGGSIRF